MFLTRMPLNPARRGTRLLLASPQRMHAAVLCGFPPEPMGNTSGGEGRVLWRVDTDRVRSTLYVSSPTRPDLTHIVEQAGWPTVDSPWQSVLTTPLLDGLSPGQHWIFRLTANPVQSVRSAHGVRGRLRGHVTVDQQEEWLRQRAAGWGFEPLRVAVVDRRTATFERRTDESSGKVTISKATFDGVLAVTDAHVFRATLTGGVGRAKGYGCGLITLAPMP